jgi:hypothetical protein
MIISHTHQFIFIKSAKTAGTSIEAALSNHCSENDIVTPLYDYEFNRDENGQWIHHSMNYDDFHQHDSAISIRNKIGKDAWDSYYKFSIARNPWDRVVSLFNWKARNDPSLRPRKRFYHRIGVPFNELRETKALFSEFVNGDWMTNDRFYVIDDELCVDFIIRYENLSGDFSEVCSRIGLDNIDLPHLKSGFRKGYHYSAYYNEQSKSVVADRHSNDIRLFGYRFESE